ncbi:MAG: DUF423 domain-containing protein [Polyangiales bacterium]
MERILLTLSGAMGFLAVALGAFGAHGLKKKLEPLVDGAQRLAWWETAAHYHLTHALALGLAAVIVGKAGGGPAGPAGWCFVAGMTIFSGSLYVMTLTGIRGLGAITPIGGLFLLAGWAQLAWAGFKLGGS